MPKGGRRLGSGNPTFKTDQNPQTLRKGQKRIPRKRGTNTVKRSEDIIRRAHAEGTTPLHFIDGEMKRLQEIGTEDALKECRLLAIAACPFYHPKLHSIASQTEATVTYVVRLPQPIKDITEWQTQTEKLLLPSPK